MIRLPSVTLPEAAQTALTNLQKVVSAKPTFAEQVAEGKREYELARKRTEFKPILNALNSMCSGAQRCHYCEDSAATDVEHIHPKDFYPQLVFDWENYLYACTRCNRPKSNRFDIHAHTTGERLSVPALVKATGTHPELGDPLLINPRLEDPMELMILDLRGTFYFFPRTAKDSRDWQRAKFTIDLLLLNEVDLLPTARAEAYGSYVARLKEYVHDKAAGSPSNALVHKEAAIKRMQHPTVWREMKRQQERIPALQELFTLAPEALTW
ncbi:MAG: hypothetical protein NT023_08865 [Armatimonadetes bacterium]|nr:hypothetical protein [Armatimonadota bacterium]